MSLKRDIEFLYEIGSLRFVERTWRQFFQQQVANDAEHMFRVAWIALVIARHENVKNEEKILKMALIHDIGESRTPDTNYLSKLYSSRDETTAISHMLEDTSLKEEMFDLYKEYEDRKSIEAKVVKDADYLDVDFEIQEHFYQGNQLRKLWPRTNVYENLFTKTAKKMWKQLYEMNPQAWHKNAHKRHKK